MGHMCLCTSVQNHTYPNQKYTYICDGCQLINPEIWNEKYETLKYWFGVQWG